MNAAATPRIAPRRHLLKRLGRVLLAPDAFDFWASRLKSTWSLDRPLARIVARTPESSDTCTLLLQPNRHWRGFRAGQHLNVSAEIDGTRVTRSYSLSDAPRADGRIAITVKAMPGGKLSQYLCHVAKPGDVLTLGPAYGEMTLPERIEGAWLFLAAGSGITPMMAMIRAQAAQGMPMPIALAYWARSRAELCFVDELRALAARQPNFRVDFVLTRDADAADCRYGRIDASLLSSFAPDLHQRRVFACGPDGFVAAARALTAERAVAFLAEAFTPPQRVDADVEGGSVQLTLAASNRVLTVPRGESLLTALEAAGLKPASGCRMGICNTCACGKRAGTTRHLHTGDVEHEPVSALRLCVNSARSDLVLDL
ncbi:MAG: ferredoxin reductase [Lysobacter sp.]|nr:ferredoxin reductase [Lysobacter sp.]